MRPFILAFCRLLACTFCILLACHCQAQRRGGYNTHAAEWTIEENHREMIRLQRETQNISVYWKKNNRGEYEFYCDNKTFSDYTVEVYFTEVINLQAIGSMPGLNNTSTPGIYEVGQGTRLLFTLRKAIDHETSHFQYHHKAYKGCPAPKVDTAFTYLLPVAPGKETRIYELHSIIREYSGESLPKDWYDLSLHVHAGDTIYAARCGRVTNVRDHADLQDSGYTYSSQECYVEIEHNDCSFGKYTVFRDNAIFVQPGQWVQAGQPIGIAGGDKYESGPQVRFCVFYHLQQDILDKDGKSTGKTHNLAYVPLYFWTKDQGKIRLVNKSAYVSEHPETVVTAEMTKKEVKKWKEAHKSS